MKILLSGGGTAGSVTPLLAVAEQIRKQRPDTEFLFLGTHNGPETVLVPNAHIPFQSISSGKLRRYWSWKNMTDMVRIIRGTIQAWRLMRRWRPDVTLGAGSFVCVPVGYAAKILNIPILVHQQDIIPGLANKLLAPWSRVVTVTFPESVKNFPSSKTEIIGNPVRQSVVRADARRGREFLHVANDRPLVVCIGGGTGAAALNTLLCAAAPELLSATDIVHLTGGRMKSTIQDPRYHAFDFLAAELPDVLAAASIVITRAGLGTLSELGALGKPAIVIPMPDTHQEANARVVDQHHAAILIDQRMITPHQFATQVISLLEDHQQRTALGTALHHVFRPGASERLASIALSYGPKIS